MTRRTESPYALDIRGLRTVFPGATGPLPIVDDVSLAVQPGEMLAVVGESGSGKSMTFMSALGLIAKQGKVESGQVMVDGVDLVKMDSKTLRSYRGSQISMIFQDPLSGLNPVFTIGDQLMEVLRAHRQISHKSAKEEAIRLLERVQIPDARRRLLDYPHQFSGGMRQRVLIAMAIAHQPKVLIADEPTTALDVTVQAQVLDLIDSLRREAGMAVVLITHDLGLVARHADRVCVMYSGKVVEEGTVSDVFATPCHPYTHALLRSIPRLEMPVDADLMTIPGHPPLPGTLREGCSFESRCYVGRGRVDCLRTAPLLLAVNDGAHLSACHFHNTLQAESSSHANKFDEV